MVASFRVGLVDFLLDQAPIRDVVGDRVYPSVLPDKATLPAIVYQVVSNLQEFTYQQAVPLRQPRIQIDGWARSRLETERIENAVAAALVGYRGPMGDVTYTAGWALENSTDLFEQETRLYRISLDFRGWYGVEQGGLS